MACGDVHHMHRLALLAQALHRILNEGLQVLFALTNAAPADGIQIVFIRHAPKAIAASGRVAVDIIQGRA